MGPKDYQQWSSRGIQSLPQQMPGTGRKHHVDAHYASAVFRYEKEFCVKFREHTTFFCEDDKHTIKVGEPGFPVAAAERGKRVIVGLNESLQVGDHDFTKFSLSPSVSLDVDIPECIDGSFYHGQVHIGLKENAFQDMQLSSTWPLLLMVATTLWNAIIMTAVRTTTCNIQGHSLHKLPTSLKDTWTCSFWSKPCLTTAKKIRQSE